MKRLISFADTIISWWSIGWANGKWKLGYKQSYIATWGIQQDRFPWCPLISVSAMVKARYLKFLAIKGGKEKDKRPRLGEEL